MKHYVLTVDYATDGDAGSDVLGIFHSPEAAKTEYDKQVATERENAENNNWTVEVDEDVLFEAHAEGDHANNHVCLYVQEEDAIDDGEWERLLKDKDDFIVEVCPFCDREVYMRWSIEEDGYVAHCPYCGETMMLCDECFHRDGNEGDGPCDYDGERCSCYRNPEGRVLPSRKAELLDNAIAHLTELAGRSEIENTLRCIGFTDYEMKMLLEVEEDG